MEYRNSILASAALLALEAGPVFAGDPDDLKAEIATLQSRLDQLEKQQSAPTDDRTTAAAPADAVVGGDFPGSFKLPGSDTSIAIHGYTKLDMIYSFDANMGDKFVESSIPGNHNALSNVGPQLRAHARQSRLTLETRTPTNYGQMGTYIETDFFGTSPGSAGGNNTSNLRLRQAYGTLGNWLFGQSWTNFMDVEDQPETLDHDGPVGDIEARQAQVRYTYISGKWEIAGALENPAGKVGQVTGTGDAAVFTPGSTVSVGSGATRTGANDVVDRMPDITASVHYTDDWGHMVAAGVIRYFAVDNGGDAGNSSGPTIQHSADTLGGGGLVGATINWGQWVGGAFAKDQLGIHGFVGQGINRYIDKASSRQGDVIDFVAADGSPSLQTQMQYGGFFWVLHHWTDQLRTNAVFGIDRQNWKSGVPVSPSSTSQIQQVESVHVNLIWSPVKSVSLGIEYMWGAVEYRNLTNGAGINGGSRGEASQLQFSAQFVF